MIFYLTIASETIEPNDQRQNLEAQTNLSFFSIVCLGYFVSAMEFGLIQKRNGRRDKEREGVRKEGWTEAGNTHHLNTQL